MNPEPITVEFVEKCLREGRLDDISNMPGFNGPLASTPELSGRNGIIAQFPAEALRPATLWTEVKRALQEAKFPNPNRSKREYADREFLNRNLAHVLFRQLGVSSSFNYPIIPDFRYHNSALPTPDGQVSEAARQHINRPERKLWPLGIFPRRDDRMIVPDTAIWRGPRSGTSAEPWQPYSAYVAAEVIPASPHSYFALRGWIGTEEITRCAAHEEGFDYRDSDGAPRVKTYSCRRVSPGELRPITELLAMLDGWNFEHLRAEGRLNPQAPIFGVRAEVGRQCEVSASS